MSMSFGDIKERFWMNRFLQFHNKTLLCFGSGSYFQIMYYDFRSSNTDFRVEGVIDSNEEKIGKSLQIGVDVIPIMSLSYVCANYKPGRYCCLNNNGVSSGSIGAASSDPFF